MPRGWDGWGGGGNGLLDFVIGSALFGNRSKPNQSNNSAPPPIRTGGGSETKRGPIGRALWKGFKVLHLPIILAWMTAAITSRHLDSEAAFPSAPDPNHPPQSQPFKYTPPPFPAHPRTNYLPELKNTPEMRRAAEAPKDKPEAHFITMKHGAAVIPTEDIPMGKGCVLPKDKSFVISQITARDVRAWDIQSVQIKLPEQVCPDLRDGTPYVPINKIRVDKSSLSGDLIGQTAPSRDSVKMSYKVDFGGHKPA